MDPRLERQLLLTRRELFGGSAVGLGSIAMARTFLFTPDSTLFNKGSCTYTPLGALTLTMGFAVACICLWGTLVGSMLPLGFKKLGIDPAMASSPFVATFVDVTGITIYLSIARIFLYSFFTGG